MNWDIDAVRIFLKSDGSFSSFFRGGSVRIFRLFLAATLVLFTTACNKEEQKVEHKVPNQDPLTSVYNAQNIGADGVAAVEVFNAKFGINELDENSIVSLFGLDDPFEDRVRPMGEKLLKEELYGYGELQNLKAERVFSKFHEAMVEALAEEDGREEVLAYVNNYVNNFILRGCDAELKNCQNKDFYRRVRSTKELVLARIHYTPGDRCANIDLNSYYNSIKMAFGFTLGQDSPRSDAYYLECSLPYLALLGEKERELRALDLTSPRKAELSAIEAALRDHGNIISQIVARTERFLGNDELAASYARFYKDFDPLAYNDSSSPSELSMVVLRNTRRRILLDDAKKGRINDASYLDAMDAAIDPTAHSYSYEAMRAYLNEKSASMLELLGVETVSERNNYLVILERIATRKWDSHLATKFFDSVKEKDRAKLQSIIEHYVRIMLLRQIAESNDEMGKFFSNIDFSTQEMITKVADKALSMQKDWVEFHEAVKVLRDFTVGALKVPYDDLSKLGIDVDGLVDITNYMVVLPHMMLLAYKMYERKFSMEIRTWFGTLRIDYADVFNYFFSSGSMAAYGARPWFDYSPGLSMKGWWRRYNTADMLNAFYFALRTGAFDLYRVKPEDFLRGTMDTLLADHQVLAREMFDVHVKEKQDHSVSYKEIKNFCEQERIRRDHQREGKPFIANYRYEINFDDLSNGILIEQPFFSEMVGSDFSDLTRTYHNKWLPYGVGGITWFMHDRQEMFDLIRLGASYWQNYLRGLRGIYSEYRKDQYRIQNGSDEITDEQEQQLSKNVKSFDYGLRSLDHDLRRVFTAYRETLEETFYDCTVTGAQREVDLFHLLYAKEIEYLKALYQEWKAALESENVEAALADINARLAADVAYPEFNYKGRTFVTDTHFHYARLDVYMRLRKHIPEVSPELAVKMPETAQDFYDSDWFVKEHLRAEIPHRRANGEEISEEDFVRMVMAYWGPRPEANNGDVYVNWAGHFAIRWGGGQLTDKLIPAVALWYMLGDVEIYESDNMGRCMARLIPDEEICKVKKSRLATLDELIGENLRMVRLHSVREDFEGIYDQMGIRNILDNQFIWSTGFSPTIYDSRLEGLVMEPDKVDEMGTLDFAYLNIAYSTLLGFRPNYPWEENDMDTGGGGHDQYNPDRITAWQSLKIYKESREKFDHLIFKLEKGTSSVLDSAFRKQYEMNRDLVAEFEQGAEDLAEEDEARFNSGEKWIGIDGKSYPFRRSVRINTSRPRVYGEYINRSYRDDWRVKLRNFNQETEFYYEPEAAASGDQ